MKSSIQNFLNLLWSITTDVPGWPDAPRPVRIRRLVPIALPLVGVLLILLWNAAWRTPHIRSERAAIQPLQNLESEVTALRLLYSEQQTTEIMAQADTASRVLLANPSELAPLLEKLKEAARTFGWDATLTVTAAPPGPAASEAQIYYLPARGKLVPLASNTEPFTSLLAYFEKLPSADKWIDLMRLSLRADDKGKLFVEVQLRAGCRVPNEKTAQ